MKKNLLLIPFAISSLFLSSCSHIHKIDGPVQKSEIPEGVQVNIGGSEVKAGDKVSVLRTVCKQVPGGKIGTKDRCLLMKTGEALVLKVLDHDSAIVRPDEGVTIDKDMKVEKK